jgi:predicted ferric reductase
LLRCAVVLFRNVRNGKNRCRATVWSIPDAVQVHVKVARPWKYRAGQYLYLCIPGVSYGARMQSHPYFVSWWYKNKEGEDVVVFIISRRGGFSASLADCPSGNLVLGVGQGKDGNPRFLLATDPGRPQGTELRASIEGPYGQEVLLGEYGTVLLLATGIGIAGLFPFVKEFFQGFHNLEVKARRIALFWEVDSERECIHSRFVHQLIANFEDHLQWLGNWMTDLLSEDTEKKVCCRTWADHEGNANLIGPGHNHLCHWGICHRGG